MSEMSCSMPGIMGYNYPIRQAQIYSIRMAKAMGYICPMEMTFIEALRHAMKVTGRGKSLRDVATRSGVSYDILKNVNQGKSEKPNAEDATKIADFFEVSLSDFYAGNVRYLGDEVNPEVVQGVAKMNSIMRRLRKPSSHEQLRLFAQSLLRAEEEALQNGEDQNDPVDSTSQTPS